MVRRPDFGQNIVQVDLDTLETDIASVVASIARARYRMDFWSGEEDLITITAASQDLALPSVVVAGIPAGATITRVIAILKYRVIEDTSAADNKISTAGPVTPAVQVTETVAAAFVDAITIIDDMMQVAASTRDNGDVLMGTIDVSAAVAGDGTYDFQLDDILADGGDLLLRDLQVGLRIEWSV